MPKPREHANAKALFRFFDGTFSKHVQVTTSLETSSLAGILYNLLQTGDASTIVSEL